jgi:hypothetical protein
MTLFHGVHEVRLFRPNSVAVGYFDNEAAALAAMEQETSNYKAAYFTLNPLKLPHSHHPKGNQHHVESPIEPRTGSTLPADTYPS